MDERFSRTELLLGEYGMDKLRASRIAIFGIGGVGGHAAEAVARCGVGKIDLIDADTVSVSNINRQIVALGSTVGKPKVEVMRDRILDINPLCEVFAHEIFYSDKTAPNFNLADYDYVIDAIDSVASKLLLIENATQAGVKIISSMGAGNKLSPTSFEVSDIYKTSVCPLARVMRTELKKRGIRSLKVVYSKEEPSRRVVGDEPKRHAPASVSFVPSVVGLIMASEVIRELSKID